MMRGWVRIAVVALVDVVAGVSAGNVEWQRHHPSERARAIIDGRRFSDDNDIADR
jgi:hypothetical protein